MVSDIEFLESMCERMQQVGLVESKTAFSTHMLGKGPSYLTSMKARDRHVPHEVMASFRQRLEGEIEDAKAMIAATRDRLAQLELQQKHRVDLLHHVEMRQAGHVPIKQDEPRCSSNVPGSVIQWLIGARGRIGSDMAR